MSRDLKLIIPIFLGIFIGLFFTMIGAFNIFDDKINDLRERITVVEERISMYELHN